MADRKLFAVFKSPIVLSASMPVGTSAESETWVPIYSVCPGIPLLKGDYIKAFAQAEFTNDLGFDVGLVTCLTLDVAPPETNEPISSSGLYLTYPCGDDFGTDNLHHKKTADIGSLELTALTAPLPATAAVKLMAAAQSTAATAPSAIAVQPQGYGSITVEIYR